MSSLLPLQISVVKEERFYPRWNPDAKPASPGEVNIRTGINAGKLALNKLHKELAAQGFSQFSSGEWKWHANTLPV